MCLALRRRRLVGSPASLAAASLVHSIFLRISLRCSAQRSSTEGRLLRPGQAQEKLRHSCCRWSPQLFATRCAGVLRTQKQTEQMIGGAKKENLGSKTGSIND